MKRSFLMALLLAGVSLVTLAQSFTGRVVGRVEDQAQAVISNATITLKNLATGAERRTVANSEGDFNLEAIPPGRYTLRVEAPGFAASAREVEVTVATTLRVDATLNPQGATESLNVAAVGEGGIAVQTESAMLGNTVSNKQIVELPTITRDPYQFIALSAGAVPSDDRRGAGFAINGQRAASGNYILDGGENNDTFVTGSAQLVPLDAVQEFRVQTNNYTAEYGRGAGFIANVVTKSGTSEYHGNLYFFNRNSALSANTFGNNARRNPRPVFNRNQFGGTFGGPLVLPKFGEGGPALYRNKERALFFGSFEPIIVRSSAPVAFYVPTPQLLNLSSPGTRRIFERYPLPTNLSSTDVIRETVTPFAGGAAVNIPTYAAVSRTGPVNVGAGNPQDTLLATGRVDVNASDRTQFFIRYAFQDTDQFPTVNQAYSAELDQAQLTKNQNILFNLTRTWSSHFVTETRLVYNRISGPTNPLTPADGFPTFGTTGSLSALGSAAGSGLAISLPRGSTIFGGAQNLYQIFHTSTVTAGNHTVKFGGQYVHLRDNRSFGSYQLGSPLINSTQNLINGILAQYTIAIDPKGKYPGEEVPTPVGAPSFTRHFHYNEPSLFVMDTWRASSRLTITPGLRWEYFGVAHSTGHEKPLDANFYYGAGSNIYERIANGRFLRTADAPGDLKGKLYRPQYDTFAPRLSVAYDLTGKGKTVFRAGAGLFYDRNFGNVVFNVIQNPPNYGTIQLNNSTATPLNLNTPAGNLLSSLYAPFNNIGASSFILRGTSARHMDENLKAAYTFSYNGTLEHEMAGMVLSASYIGSSASRLYTLTNINRAGSGRFLPASFGRQPGQRLNLNISSINTRGNLGHSTYHALQLKVDSRINQKTGLQFGSTYTWSHSIDNNSSILEDDLTSNGLGVFGFQDSFDPSLDKGPSAFDIRHRLQVNFNWQSPFWRNTSNTAAKTFLGGWQLIGLLQYQTGAPFSLFDTGVPNFAFSEQPRPRLTGAQPEVSVRADPRTPNLFFYLPVNPIRSNGACIATAQPFACGADVNGPFGGTLSRNSFRRPGTIFQDLSVFKNFDLPRLFGREGVKFQFRTEFYNAFNHANLWVNGRSTDINVAAPAVTASRGSRNQDNRQIVLAGKLIF